MIRKLLVGAGAASVAVAAAIAVDAGHLASYVNKVNSSPGLDVTYTVNEVGGTQTKYHVVLSKPNMAYIDMPGKTYIADGKDLTVYDKKLNSYFVKPQPQDLLPEVFKDEEVSLWRPFFNAKVWDNVAATKNEGTRKSRGETLDSVSAQVDKAGDYTIRLHLSQKDGLPRQAEFVSKLGSTEKIRIVNVESISATKPATSMFAFAPPAGAKQLTEADMMAAEWGHDFNKALENAAAFGKGVIVDFYADW
jgi:outer membrane lipoprotein-sorting protein